jgi:chorismate mutase
MKSVRAFRGATQLSADTKAEMREAVVELLQEILKANLISGDDLISILFTATPDLQSDFPAAGVRELGLVDLPLSRSEVAHKYLRGAAVLRPDLAQKTDKPGINSEIDGEK